MPADALSLDEHGFPMLDGQPLKLPPKERAVLALLLRRRPAVVSKDDFALEAWQGVPMSDESLARSISRVRRAVAGPGWQLESVYGTGYRLLPPAGEGARPAESGGPARWAAAAQAAPGVLDTFLHARQLVQQRTPEAMDRAIGLLRTLVREHPDYTPASVALAEALTAAVGWGQLDTPAVVRDGLSVLDAAAARDAHTPGLAAARGALLDMAWRFDEAAQAHAQALRTGANDPDTLMLHARHLLYTGQAAAAVGRLRHALTLAPHHLMLRMHLARALVQAGQGEAGLAEADAALADHPGQLVIVAFALAIRAMVAPEPGLAVTAWRLTEGRDTPPFVWTVLSFVLARLQQREPALDIVDASLLCSRTTPGEATLYAAPLACLGEYDRAAALLRRALDERCGMLAMVLRDPVHADWLRGHPEGRRLLAAVFGPDGA